MFADPEEAAAASNFKRILDEAGLPTEQRRAFLSVAAVLKNVGHVEPAEIAWVLLQKARRGVITSERDFVLLRALFSQPETYQAELLDFLFTADQTPAELAAHVATNQLAPVADAFREGVARGLARSNQGDAAESR